jgi:three-Cys-motif partner protein
MAVSLADYAGREQAYVKHVFLQEYLEVLAHKTASTYPHIIIVDGFAGPWQSANERFEDTSFGVGLTALRAAKESWKKQDRTVRMSAHLVERNKTAYAQLATILPKYLDIEIKTYQADFLSVLPQILADLPKDAFVLFLIDPKGWRLPLNALKDMLSRPNSEVIFNFMFDFINRAASIDDPKVVAGLNELIPHGSWRATLKAAQEVSGGMLTSDARKTILVGAFNESLAQLGGYNYVAETTVLRPLKDRPLYCLCYATRHRAGIKVFRDCQMKALQEQAAARAGARLKHTEVTSGQNELFESLHDMGPDKLDTALKREKSAARDTLLALTPEAPGVIKYEDLWPQVLSRHIVRLTELNALAAELRKSGELLFPDWETGKRVPQDHYSVQRAPKSGLL